MNNRAEELVIPQRRVLVAHVTHGAPLVEASALSVFAESIAGAINTELDVLRRHDYIEQTRRDESVSTRTQRRSFKSDSPKKQKRVQTQSA